MMTTSVCPQCGFEIGDEEMCRACGALIEDISVRDVSLTLGIGRFFAGLKDKGIHGAASTCIGDPGAAPLFLMKRLKNFMNNPYNLSNSPAIFLSLNAHLSV